MNRVSFGDILRGLIVLIGLIFLVSFLWTVIVTVITLFIPSE